MKASELSGPALDWAVATCEGLTIGDDGQAYDGDFVVPTEFQSWHQGGPIIEREEIGIRRNAPCSLGREWEASPSITAKGAGGKWGYGPTPLIAGMRCYVASKLGEEIEIPEGLI